MVLMAGLVCLAKALRSHDKHYSGKTVEAWIAGLRSLDTTTSNAAFKLYTARILPDLLDTLQHDTKDSSLRLQLIDLLDKLPGIDIHYDDATARRRYAGIMIGQAGQASTNAVPALLEWLLSKDAVLEAGAADALSRWQAAPGTVVPRLVTMLADNNVNEAAAWALAAYGTLATDAFPRLLPLTNSLDKSLRGAARVALRNINPAEAARVGIK